MLVILEDGPAARRVYRHPRALLSARTVAEAPAVLAAIDTALGQGLHVAGWLGYELGYALEPRLHSLARNDGPLLHLGLFEGPSDHAPQPSGRAYAGPPDWEWDEAAYGRRFAQVKAYIAAATSIRPISASAPASLSRAIPWRFMKRCGKKAARAIAPMSMTGRGNCSACRRSFSSPRRRTAFSPRAP